VGHSILSAASDDAGNVGFASDPHHSGALFADSKSHVPGRGSHSSGDWPLPGDGGPLPRTASFWGPRSLVVHPTGRGAAEKRVRRGIPGVFSKSAGLALSTRIRADSISTSGSFTSGSGAGKRGPQVEDSFLSSTDRDLGDSADLAFSLGEG
jgi:hypothetical protein